MRDRMASMSPEERQQMIERMKARGFTLPAEGQAASGNTQPVQPQQGRGQRAASGQAKKAGTPAKATPAQGAGATTIDALFGPLPPTESFGQVWLNQNGKLNRVRLRLGISDGQQTELIQVLDNNSKIDEGTEVVTAVTTAAQRTTATAGGNAFPGLGGQQRGGGGFPGGGGGGNRGAPAPPRGR
jgi:hypothetical protein